jgi:hypothetical protein
MSSRRGGAPIQTHPSQKTRIYAVLMISILFFCASKISFATSDSVGTIRNISIYLNDQPLNFSSEPIITGGILYVPVMDLASEFGMYYQRSNSSYAVLYKNNLFLKFTKDSSTAYMNGAPLSMRGPVFEEANRLYVPIEAVSTALDYEDEWDSKTGTYLMKSGGSDYKFSFFKDSFYKKIFIDEFGVNISVPLHWDRLATNRQSYGFIDSRELFSVQINAVKLPAGESLEDWQENVRKSTLSTPGIVGSPRVDTLTTTRIDSHTLEYSVSQGLETRNHVIYVFLQERVGYTIEFVYNEYIDAVYARSIIRNVAESFQVDKLTIRESEEHYVEYKNFFEMGITLNYEIYSNQSVFNTQRFEGELKNPDGTEQLLVTVSKGTEKLEFVVPIEDGAFSGRIYLPFGLGKHNILIEKLEKNGLIFGSRRDANFEPRINYSQNNVMQFSLINVSGDKIRYLVPTSRIPSDHEQIHSVSNLLTYKDVTQYSKSRSLYLWILENIRLDSSEQPYRRSALEVFNDEVGTEEEVSLLYAAFLRSIGIPARIATGFGRFQQHVWVEVFINGEWRVMDIGHDFEKTNGTLNLSHFWLDRQNFYKNYDKIISLNE